MDRALIWAAALLVVMAAWAPPARGALPPRHGGALTLPAADPVRRIDPATMETAFEATLVEAVYDNLYEQRPDGTVQAVLADGPPEVRGTTARVHLRDGVRRHRGGPLRARHVVRSLLRAATSPSSSWLFGAFAWQGSAPLIREIDPTTIEFELARRGVRLDLILAARPLAIVAGGDVRRPIGTGAFSARLDRAGGVELRIFRHAVDRPPWLNRVRFTPVRPRDEEIRAYELGQLDGSWQGRSLFGREPSRPAVTLEAQVATPWLLVRNRSGRLREDRLFGGVVAAIDRQRLARVGLVPRRSLSRALPAPQLPSGSAPRDLMLRLPVRTDRPQEVRCAEAIAGMLDEHGVRLRVERLSATQYRAALSHSRWDLRIARVRPPLPGRGPTVGAALAAAGQQDLARDLVPRLGRAAVANRAARQLDAMVLGHERIVLHHRADVRHLRIDSAGRLSLADASFARPAEPFR